MTASMQRLLLLALLFLTLQAAKAGPVVDGETDAGTVTQGRVNNEVYDHIYTGAVGGLYGTDVGNDVTAFALPYLAPGQQITSATLTWYLQGYAGTPSMNIQLYGLKRVSTTDSSPSTADFYAGANDTANTLLAAKFATPSTPANSTVSYTGANLLSFVQNQYGNSAFSGMDLSPNRFIFFRLSPDAAPSGFNNYIFALSRNPIRSQHPTLALAISNGISAIAGRLQFSFNLPVSSITSAGVYDSNGKLLRTIWNNVRYQAGTNYGVWDGKDDSGKTLASGTNYTIKMIYHNVQYTWDGVIGNTSANSAGTHVWHAFGKVHDMAIGNGYAYYTVGYNELESNFHQFTVGTPQVPSQINFGYDWGDPFAAFYYCATDGTRSYWAKVYGGESGENTYVVGITNGGSGQGGFYTFPKGTVPTGNNQHYPSCVDFDSTANQPNGASGLAVQKSGSYLFVAHDNLNLVRVFDKVQGSLIGSFSVPNPKRMACTANGDVWVVSSGSTPSVNRYTFSGTTATLKQTITGFNSPLAVGVSADDNLVLVADGGTSQQIKAYNNASGTAAWTYGTLGGMASNGPNVATNVFQFSAQRSNFNDFSPESFIVFQADNTFWVNDPGSGRVVHYSINGNTPVYIEQVASSDASYRSTVDVGDPTRVFNNFLEYSVDYSLPVGGTNGSWKLTRNWAFGLPNDSSHLYWGFAQGFISVATLSNGRTYGLIDNFITNNYDLFELPPSGGLRYTGYTFTNGARIYEDGSLRFNVVAPNNASVAFYSAPLTGFDAYNNPVWGSPETLGSTPLGSTDPIPWVAFPMRTEMTTSGMLVDFDGNFADTGYHIAAVPRKGTAFQWRAAPSTNGTRTSWFPQDGRFDIGNGVQYAGNIAMAQGRDIVYGYHGEFWSAGEASQWVDMYDNGLMVGLFGTFESAAMMGPNTSVPGFAGNSFSPTLIRGPDGNGYLYHNDESDHGGTCRWKITGWDGITEISGTGAIGGTASINGTATGPMVSITSPTLNATYLNGNNVLVSASVAGGGAAITSVQFFDGSTSLGSITASPYSMNVAMASGTHTLTAKATDASGNTDTSDPVTFTIGTDGQNSAPPTPVSLTATTVTSASVGLKWTQPDSSTTSSTIGQIISLQCATSTDTTNALPLSSIAGAGPYAVANFNKIGQNVVTNGITFPSIVNSLGNAVPNLGLTLAMSASNDTNSTQSLTGTATKLFGSVVSATFNTTIGITVSNIPYGNYDVVVYTLPPNVSSGTKTASVIVSDSAFRQSTVSLTFNKLPTGYTTGSTPLGTNASMTNVNAVVVQGLTAPTLEVQGGYIAAIQIVQRPYDQGNPTSYTIQRATGTSGSFTTVGTASGTAVTYTDSSSVAGGTSYQYRIQASNDTGPSGYSNIVTVTTPGVNTSTTPVNSFSSWQSKYYTAAQLADPTIGGPGADPYGSGVPNLLAYALQLDPSTAKPTDVPQPVVVNGHLQVTYFVPTAVTDVSYIVEVSSNLATWNSGTGYTQTLSNVTNSTGHTITVQDTLPATEGKHFMRLRVTQH